MEEKNKGQLAGAPIDTQYPSDTYPTGYSYKQRGGPFFAANIEQMLAIPLERLYVNCQCIVAEDAYNAMPRTSYILRKLPLKKTAAPLVPVLNHPDFKSFDQYEKIQLSVDESYEGFFLNYWQVLSRAEDFDGEYDEEFAADYTGSYYQTSSLPASLQPPFPYDKDAAWHSTNWTDTLAPSRHSWKRIRYGQGKWSKPIALFDQGAPGDYIDSRFKWHLTQNGAPPRPFFMLPDGLSLNNQPALWSDGLPGKPAGDYSLWEIRGAKNAFGDLKSPWIGPFKIPVDGNLVRYSLLSSPDPNSLVNTATEAGEGTPGGTLLSQKGFYTAPKPESIFRIRRNFDSQTSTYSLWAVERILQEEGESRRFIYRDFPIRLANHIAQFPDDDYLAADGGDGKPFRPQGSKPAGWSELQNPTPAAGFVSFESQAVFLGATLKGAWSDPVPKGQIDTVIAVITSDKGNDFRLNPNNGVRPFETMTLTASLYRGRTLLNAGSPGDSESITYNWQRIRNFTDTTPAYFGNGRSQAITHLDVEGSALFECSQVLSDGKGNSETYTARFEVLDIPDGLNARQLVLKNPSPFFVRKGAAITPTSLLLEAFPINIAYGTNDFVWSYRNAQAELLGQAYQSLANSDSRLTLSFGVYNGHKGAFSDYVTYRVSLEKDGVVYEDQARVGLIDIQDGVSGYFMALGNEFVQIPVAPDGTPQIAQASLPTLYYTSFAVYAADNTNQTGSYTPTIAINKITQAGATGSDIALTATIDNVLKKVSLTEWGKGVVEASIDIILTDNTGTLPEMRRTWRLRRLLNGAELVLLADIDVDDASPSKGFTFAPGATQNKILKARAILNGVEVTDFTGYTFDFQAEGKTSSAQTITLTPDDVDVINTVRLSITHPSGIVAFTMVDIIEMQDAASLDVVFNATESKPVRPQNLMATYKPCATGLVKGSQSSAVTPFWIDNTAFCAGGYNVQVTMYHNGGVSWQIYFEQSGFAIKSTGYSGSFTYPYNQISPIGTIDRIGLAPIGNASAETDIVLEIMPLSSPDQQGWYYRQDASSVWRSEKRSFEGIAGWSDPILIRAQQGAAGKAGGFMATFVTVQPRNYTSVIAPRATVAPEQTGSKLLKDSFISDNNTWYGRGALPAYNPYSEVLWESSKLVRFDAADNYISYGDFWTPPRRIGGTDGLAGETTLFVFRRQTTKPAGQDLPVNSLNIEESGGAKWSVTIPVGAAQVWMCKARFTWNTITGKYKQAENFTQPLAFEAIGSKTVVLYHYAVNSNIFSEPALPADSPDYVFSQGSSYNSQGWKPSSDSNSIWKAEAYFNGSWSAWLLTRLQGPPGAAGKDGITWLLYENLSRTDEQATSFLSLQGKAGDFALRTDGRVYRKTTFTSQLWVQHTYLASKWYAYEEIDNAGPITGNGFITPTGLQGDMAMSPAGGLYKKNAANTFVPVGQLFLEGLFEGFFWSDRVWQDVRDDNDEPTGIQYRKRRDNVVVFRGVFVISSSNQQVLLTTMPAGYRPWEGDLADKRYYDVYKTTIGTRLTPDFDEPLCSLWAQTDGEIYMRPLTITTAIVPVNFNGFMYHTA